MEFQWDGSLSENKEKEMIERERKGWTWVEVGKGGFWMKDDVENSHDHKLPFFCPNCKKITGTIDDECLTTYGFCKECYVMYVEDRKTPAIDLEKFKPNSKKQK
jgi:hypothetical protein